MKISGNKMLRRVLSTIILLLFISPNIFAGDYLPNGYILNDTINPKKEHSPRKAWMYSALLPGLGQAYNKKYWKIPIIYAGMGTLFYLAQERNKQYKKYKEGYIDFLNYQEGDSLATSFKKLDKINIDSDDKQIQDQLEWYKDQYRRNRDLMIIGMAGVYFLNIIDSMVDAHFYDYDVSDDISLKIEPDIKNSPIFAQSFRLSMRIKF